MGLLKIIIIITNNKHRPSSSSRGLRWEEFCVALESLKDVPELHILPDTYMVKEKQHYFHII